jgi:elongation factor P hydroxylase
MTYRSSSNFVSLADKNCDQLLNIFNDTFLSSHNTCLQKGADEPLYRPAGDGQQHHCIAFTRDYYASALHEIAHWCVAGEARRQQLDYGYWYAPDGRNETQQREFESVEVAPQALEWMFSQAVGIKFRVSADNLAMGLGASAKFKDRIHARVMKNCTTGVNARAHAFIMALQHFYDRDKSLQGNSYERQTLD